MRIRFPLALGLLLLVPVAHAQEDGEAAPLPPHPTVHVPKWSPICVRLSSLDRMDVVVKEALPLLKAIGLGQQVAPLEHMPASVLFFSMSGLDAATVDKSRPVYMGLAGEDDPVFVFHAAEGAAWEGDKALMGGFVGQLRGGAVVCGSPGAVKAETRGAPAKFLDGDVVVHVFLDEITTRYREQIEGGLAQAAMQAGGAPIPDAARALVLPVMGAVKDTIYGAQSFDYALSWKDVTLWSEGLLRTKEGSGLRKFFAGAGAPGDTSDLVAFLPKDGFVFTDGVVNPGWPMDQIGAMLDRALGEGKGKALLTIIDQSASLSPFLSGRHASCVALGGMMSMSVTTIGALKEGVDPKTVFANYSVEEANAAMAKVGFPLEMKLDKAIAKHGDTELHRLTMQSERPELAMALAMMQTYFAAEGGHFFMVMAPTAEDDLRTLIDQVRAGTRVEDHPHSKAMARLGRGRNMGITINVGAIKPMAMGMAMFMPPQAVQGIGKLPYELFLSTSITMHGGDLHWRGNWPVAEIAKVVAAFNPQPAAKEKVKEEEEFK